MSAATSCLNVVPSQFLSVVLNDNEQHSSRKLEIPKPSAVSSQYHPYLKENNHRLKTERKANLRQKEREREKWDQLTKLLPKALLAECTVEIHRRPFLPNRQEEKLQRLCFDARVSPVFTKPQSVLQLKRRNLQQPSSSLLSNNHHVIESEEEEEEDDEEETQQLMNENGNILTLIEAVYSDEDNSQAEEDEEEVDGDDYRRTSGKLKAIKSEPSSPLPSVSTTLSTNGNSGNGIPMFKCEHCPNEYPNRGALWQHSVATHSVEKTCECKICGRKFYRNCSLALHLKSHSEEENCACKECGKSFSRLINLERHMKVHSDGVPEQLQCDLCNKLFKSQDLLQLHYQSAHSLSISCSVCGKSFANFGELMSHDATHTFEQRYICKYCKKTFSQKALLKKHIVIHTVKRLKCDKCGIEFTQRSSLLRHMKRIHSPTLNGTREETTLTNGNNTVLVHEPNITMDVDTEDDNVNEFVAVDMNEDEDDNNGSDGDDEVEDNEDEFVQEDGDNEEDDNEKFYDDIEEIELSETETING